MVVQIVIFLYILEIFYFQLTTSPGLVSRKVKLSRVMGIVPLSFQLTSDCCLIFLLRYNFLVFSQYKECLDCDTLSLQNACQEKHCLSFLIYQRINCSHFLSDSFLSNRTLFFPFYDAQQRGRKSHAGKNNARK